MQNDIEEQHNMLTKFKPKSQDLSHLRRLNSFDAAREEPHDGQLGSELSPEEEQYVLTTTPILSLPLAQNSAIKCPMFHRTFEAENAALLAQYTDDINSVQQSQKQMLKVSQLLKTFTTEVAWKFSLSVFVACYGLRRHCAGFSPNRNN